MTKDVAARFSWWKPKFGFVLVSPQKPDRGPIAYDPDYVFLRPAASAGDLRRSLSTEILDESLKAKLKQPTLKGKEISLDERNKSIYREDIQGERYWPLLSYSGLYKTFADAEPNAEGFLAFANQYGYLKVDYSFLKWHKDVLMMRKLLKIWELYRKDDVAALYDLLGGFLGPRVDKASPDRKNLVKTRNFKLSFWADLVLIHDPSRVKPDERPQKNRSIPGRYNSSSFGFDKRIHWKTTSGDLNVILATRFYVLRMISHSIDSNAFFMTTLRSDERCKKDGSVFHEDSMSRQLAPKNLLGAIWLQLDDDVAGSKEHAVCVICGKWFERNRPDHVTCGNACRKRKERKQKKESDTQGDD